MANTILLKQSSLANAKPSIATVEFGELALNTADGKAYMRVDDGIVDTIRLVNDVPIANTFFVTTTGDNTNDGRTWTTSLATIEQALTLATARKLVDPAAITLIEVGPGRYETQGHLDMPDDCVVRCTHRTVIIYPEPGFEERNQFRLGSGCFIEGFLFEGFRLDDLVDPSEGFAVSFRPGAVIRRTPYAHKIAVRTVPTWTSVPPPLDPFSIPPNPFVPRGAGVALADGTVCSPYSIFPNIMTWGATPVSANGVGYCAKNGGLVNAINAVSIWCHKHFLALTGGQIILSACSTQFGDFSMFSNGSRQIVFPTGLTTATTLTIELASALIIEPIKGPFGQIVEDTYMALDTTIDPATGSVYTFGWTAEDQLTFRTYASELCQVLIWVLSSADEIPMENYTKTFFDTLGAPLITGTNFIDAYLFAFAYIRDYVVALPGMSANAIVIVTALIDDSLIPTFTNPQYRTQPSTITAVGHTWSGTLAGVALTRIPPAFNRTNIEASIVEQNDGVVIASGQDDQGSALFVGGMKIDADTGELSGPPFDQAVGRIATKSAIAFGNF
jgi:hypothetical protein